MVFVNTAHEHVFVNSAQVQDPGSMILGPASRDSGSRFQNPGSWIPDPAWIPCMQDLDPGSWILNPVSRILDLGSR